MCCPIFEVEHRSFVRSAFFLGFVTVEVVVGPSQAFAVQRSRALAALCTQSAAQPRAIRRVLLSKKTGNCFGSSSAQAIRSVNELPLREPGVARLHCVECLHAKRLIGLKSRNEAWQGLAYHSLHPSSAQLTSAMPKALSQQRYGLHVRLACVPHDYCKSCGSGQLLNSFTSSFSCLSAWAKKCRKATSTA